MSNKKNNKKRKNENKKNDVIDNEFSLKKETKDLSVEYENEINLDKVEKRIYDIVTKEIVIGSKYNREGLKKLSNKLKEQFGDITDIRVLELERLLKNIYNVKRIQRVASELDFNNSYICNPNPTETKKRINCFEVISFKTIEDIKAEFGIDESDKSLENFIASIKTKIDEKYVLNDEIDIDSLFYEINSLFDDIGK